MAVGSYITSPKVFLAYEHNSDWLRGCSDGYVRSFFYHEFQRKPQTEALNLSL